MTTPNKPDEDIGMRDVVKNQEYKRAPELAAANLNSDGPGLAEVTAFNLKLRKDRLVAFDQHPALTALKRLAGEFREEDKKWMQVYEPNIAEAYRICAARLEQAIKEVEG